MSALPKLEKKFKKAWVKALRSGEYKQGDGHLFNSHTETYCCLGVAGRVKGINNKALNMKGLPDQLPKACANRMPAQLRGDEQNPLVDKLASYNDGGKSFNWIASWIDRYL